jgi:hypothetical protein
LRYERDRQKETLFEKNELGIMRSVALGCLLDKVRLGGCHGVAARRRGEPACGRHA